LSRWLLSLVLAAFALALSSAGAGVWGDPPFAGVSVAAGDCSVAAADVALDIEEQAFLAIINDYRADNGRQPLAASYTLSKSAQWKSKDMGVNRYVAHDDLSRTWVQRNRDCGYTANAYMAENIAVGTSSAQATFTLWRNSSAHNANMLDSRYEAIGIGRAYVAGSPYGWYWTAEFASESDGWPVTGADSDGDGCSDTEEMGTDVTRGGRRDPTNLWDFYDVDGSKRVDSVDLLLVRTHFNSGGPTPLADRKYDRSAGNDNWAPGPPDNSIDATDVGLVRQSFGHDCTAAL